MALLELSIGVVILAALLSLLGYGAYRVVARSDWFVKGRQRRNMRSVERRARVACREHGKSYALQELVLKDGTLICPDCYRDHLSAGARPDVLTDVGGLVADASDTGGGMPPRKEGE